MILKLLYLELTNVCFGLIVKRCVVPAIRRVSFYYKAMIFGYILEVLVVIPAFVSTVNDVVDDVV